MGHYEAQYMSFDVADISASTAELINGLPPVALMSLLEKEFQDTMFIVELHNFTGI